MKILFVYKYANYEPLGIMTLSTVLKNHGHNCSYIDLKFENNIFNKIKKISPDIVAYSITTGSHTFYQKFNEKLKSKFDFISVFGGPHCTFFPEFINSTGVDIICRGEGEDAITELADNLENGLDILNIKNLWIKKDSIIHKNEVANLCQNLDSIPIPDRSLTNKYLHYKKMQRRDIITSRGCPYNCSYCFNHANKEAFKGKGNYVRQRSVENVISELKLLKETNNAKTFHFQDDIFILNKKWTLEFCNRYQYEIGLAFEVQLRVNLVDEEIIKALKNAGCTLIMYGIESGNQYIRNNILNRDISDETILKSASLFNKYKIRTMSVNILGLPDETLEMAIETVKLNIKCKPNYAWNSIYQPYPMTKLAEYSREKNLFDGDVNSFKKSFLYGRSVIKTKDIRKIERLHYLFSTAVSIPILLPIIIFLSKLPFLTFYKMIFVFHRVIAAFFSLRRIKISEIILFEQLRLK